MNPPAMELAIHTLTVGQLRTHCYIVSAPGSDLCAVIDPGAEPERILSTLNTLGLRCTAVLLTHSHPDHAGAAAAVCKETKAILYLHPKAESFSKQFARDFPEASRFASMLVLPYAVKVITEGDRIAVGGLCFQVLSCPGHTPDGLAFLCADALFTGDTLFKGTCGRYDLPGSDKEALRNSLKKLSALPGNPKIYPGHGYYSTLEQERQENPTFLTI